MTAKPPLLIPHHGCVLVADGRKALVLRNEGYPLNPNLQIQQVTEAPPNPATHEQGTDRPTRVRVDERRSAIAQTDWHEQAEQRFAAEIAEGLARLAGPISALVIVAAPRTLAVLRLALPERLRRIVVAEVDQDLTKNTVSEIQEHLCAR
ncbi:host attachment protein [Methylobacterium currus]|uniref:Host attachment protein n=1 Tax=Methylobacterium currus TaxID=2051553 RepID=A0A2R4WNG1_9HYPH|nr:host attachment protein [Methylobacterium currus]AWB23081.1 host attachment protein [Methylobacterium currus]UHC17110.1 host attachment protein [Methylobacterium currus]